MRPDERCTAGDRCRPLGADGVWTRPTVAAVAPVVEPPPGVGYLPVGLKVGLDGQGLHARLARSRPTKRSLTRDGADCLNWTSDDAAEGGPDGRCGGRAPQADHGDAGGAGGVPGPCRARVHPVVPAQRAHRQRVRLDDQAGDHRGVPRCRLWRRLCPGRGQPAAAPMGGGARRHRDRPGIQRDDPGHDPAPPRALPLRSGQRRHRAPSRLGLPGRVRVCAHRRHLAVRARAAPRRAAAAGRPGPARLVQGGHRRPGRAHDQLRGGVVRGPLGCSPPPGRGR